MTHQYHFKSSIDTETIDARAEARGCTSRAEYIRLAIREEMQRGEAEARHESA